MLIEMETAIVGKSNGIQCLLVSVKLVFVVVSPVNILVVELLGLYIGNLCAVAGKEYVRYAIRLSSRLVNEGYVRLYSSEQFQEAVPYRLLAIFANLYLMVDVFDVFAYCFHLCDCFFMLQS